MTIPTNKQASAWLVRIFLCTALHLPFPAPEFSLTDDALIVRNYGGVVPDLHHLRRRLPLAGAFPFNIAASRLLMAHKTTVKYIEATMTKLKFIVQTYAVFGKITSFNDIEGNL